MSQGISTTRQRTGPAGRARVALRRALGLRRSEGGTAAVEFAILSLPFLALVGGTLETGMAFWAQMGLEQAVADASREIYTGEFQNDNKSTKDTTTLLTRFRTLLCTENGKARFTLFNCDNVRVNVTVQDDFSSLTPTSPTQVNAKTGVQDWNPSFGASYSCARSSSVVLVQVAVDYPVFFKLLNPAAVSLPNNRRVLQAASVFRAEPYDSKAACS